MTKAFRVCLHTLHFFFCSPTLHSRSSIFTQNHRKVQDGAAKAAGQAGKPIQAHHSEDGIVWMASGVSCLLNAWAAAVNVLRSFYESHEKIAHNSLQEIACEVVVHLLHTNITSNFVQSHVNKVSRWILKFGEIWCVPISRKCLAVN